MTEKLVTVIFTETKQVPEQGPRGLEGGGKRSVAAESLLFSYPAGALSNLRVL